MLWSYFLGGSCFGTDLVGVAVETIVSKQKQQGEMDDGLSIWSSQDRNLDAPMKVRGHRRYSPDGERAMHYVSANLAHIMENLTGETSSSESMIKL